MFCAIALYVQATTLTSAVGLRLPIVITCKLLPSWASLEAATDDAQVIKQNNHTARNCKPQNTLTDLALSCTDCTHELQTISRSLLLPWLTPLWELWAALAKVRQADQWCLCQKQLGFAGDKQLVNYKHAVTGDGSPSNGLRCCGPGLRNDYFRRAGLHAKSLCLRSRTVKVYVALTGTDNLTASFRYILRIAWGKKKRSRILSSCTPFFELTCFFKRTIESGRILHSLLE